MSRELVTWWRDKLDREDQALKIGYHEMLQRAAVRALLTRYEDCLNKVDPGTARTSDAFCAGLGTAVLILSTQFVDEPGFPLGVKT